MWVIEIKAITQRKKHLPNTMAPNADTVLLDGSCLCIGMSTTEFDNEGKIYYIKLKLITFQFTSEQKEPYHARNRTIICK